MVLHAFLERLKRYITIDNDFVKLNLKLTSVYLFFKIVELSNVSRITIDNDTLWISVVSQLVV